MQYEFLLRIMASGAFQALLLSAAAILMPQAAQAQNAVNGKMLYDRAVSLNGCAASGCHSANPASDGTAMRSKVNTGGGPAITTAIGKIGVMNYLKVTAAEANDMAAYIKNPASGTGAASFSISPTSYTFTGTTTVGGTSAMATFTVTNSGTSAMSLTGISVSGAFQLGSGTCSAGASVAANGGTCTVLAAFKPTAAGATAGALSIAHNAINVASPASVSLSGTGAAAPAPTISVSTAPAFANTNVGSSSTVDVTVSNSGNAALTLGALSASGAVFSISGGTCASNSSVAAGSSCSITVRFTPSAAGAATGSLSIPHNASNAASPVAVSLTGSGVALAPAISVPTSLAFGSVVTNTSITQSLTVSNTGNAALQITGIAAAGDFTIAGSSTCVVNGSVAPAGNCKIDVTFKPAATGARNAALSITHNAPANGTVTQVALTGNGTATAQPTLSTSSPTGVAFASVTTGSSLTTGATGAPALITVTNTGQADLTLSALAISGANANEFTRGGGTCTPTSKLTPQSTAPATSSCTISITFTAGAVGAKIASLDISSDASNGSLVKVALTGSSAAAPAPAVTLAPTSLDFGNVAPMMSAQKTVTLTNSGNAALSITGVAAPAGTVFKVANGCGNTLAAGANCLLTVTFNPAAVGVASDSIKITTNAAGSPHTLNLTGTGQAGTTTASMSPTAVSFLTAVVNQGAESKVLTVTNTGGAALVISGISVTSGGVVSSDFTASGPCLTVGTVASGATCTLNVAFTPQAAGARTATISLQSNAVGAVSADVSGIAVQTAAPHLKFSVAALDFGSVPRGSTSAPQTITLTSDGTNDLTVSAITASTGFTADFSACGSLPFKLSPATNPSCSVAVSFKPSASGSFSGELLVASDSNPATGNIALGGSGAQTNVGAGGCSIGSDDRVDPSLWLLAAFAFAGAWLKRRRPRSIASQKF